MKLLKILAGFNLFLLAFASSFLCAGEKINFWEHSPKEEQDVLDLLIKEFESQNKDISVKRSHFKTEDLRPQFQTAALGGGGADLVLAPNDFAGPFSVMGLIKPVQKLIKASLFIEPAIQAVSAGVDENIWGIPLSSGNHLLLFVNRQMLFDAKLEPKAPSTLEDLLSAAKKVVNPATKTYGLAYNQSEPFWFIPFYLGFGGIALDGKKPSLGNEAMTNALTMVEKIKSKDKVGPADCDYTCAETLFIEGKSAFTINGDWAISKFEGELGKLAEQLKEKKKKEKKEGDLVPGDPMAIAPLPIIAASGKRMTSYVSGKYLFFNSRSKSGKFEAARKFSEFLLLPKNQVKLALAAGRLPAVKAAMSEPEIAGNKSFMASLEAMKLGIPMPMAVEMRAVWDAIRPQLQATLAGVTDPKAASEKIQKLAEFEMTKMQKVGDSKLR